MKINKEIISGISTFAIIGLYTGILTSFWPYWLSTIGLPKSVISIVVGIPFLFSAFSSIPIGILLDRVGIRKISRISTALILSGYLFIHFFRTGHVIITCVAVISLFFSCVVQTRELLALFCSERNNIPFGKIKFSGVISFGATIWLTGKLSQIFQDDIIIFSIIASCVLMLLNSLLIPDIQYIPPQMPVFKNLLLLLKDRTFLVLALSLALISSSHAAYFAFSTIYWKNIGITTVQISYLWIVALAAESLMYLFKSRLLKVDLTRMVIICALSTIARWAVTGSTTQYAVIILAQCMHAFSSAGVNICIAELLLEKAPAEKRGLYGGFIQSGIFLVMSVSTFCAGFIYTQSPRWTFYLMSIPVIAALILLGLVLRSRSAENPESA